MNKAILKSVSVLLAITQTLMGEVRPFSRDSIGFYETEDMKTMDLDDPSSRWCYERSAESAHFICFWESGFGSDPNSDTLPENYRVDVNDLLRHAEKFRNTNIYKVRMVTVGNGTSRLDKYKMHIYLLYTDDWVAEGAGVDDMIGALWVSPMACNPVGSTLAHEVGHCFQYQVYCDKLMRGEAEPLSGFRYGYEGSNGGNGFWEQCAQWLSFLDYPEESTLPWDLDLWTHNSSLAFEHEWTRYQSFWLQNFLAKKHGTRVIGRIWNESSYPEDALSVYTRLYCDGSADKRNDVLYEYAVSMVTGSSIPESCENFLDKYVTELYDAGSGWRQVGYASCPGIAGLNIIPLDIPRSGTVSVEFKALSSGSALAKDDPGLYRVSDPQSGDPVYGGEVRNYNETKAAPGHRYGIAALNSDESFDVTEPCSSESGTVRLELSENVSSLYFVVIGTPGDMSVNPWDDDERTDAQFPYMIREK